MTPDEIEQLFSSKQPPPGSAREKEGEEASLPGSEKSQRAENLGRVLATARHLWETGSKDLDVVAEKIGNGVRDGSWRIPLGESQLLDFFIGIVGTDELRKPLVIHTLRIIGNSCADTDQNRQRVVATDCLPRIVKLLRDDPIIPLVAPVLFNICVDYEPAQVAAYKAGLNPEIINLLSGPRLRNAEGSMSIICKLLRLVANQEPEADLIHPDTPFTLLSLAAAKSPEETASADDDDDDDDVEDFLGQASVALTYLAHTQFQDVFLAQPNAIPLFLRVFSRACSELGATAASASAAQFDAEELAQLKKTQSVFMQVLADLSAHPAFAAACPLEGPEVATLRRWIASSSSSSSSSSSPSSSPTHASSQLLSSAACLALGNIARSDAACIWLVESAQVHKPLIAIVSDESKTDAQLLHAALGFLKNLGIPATNKAVLGGAGLLEDDGGVVPVLPRLWQISAQPQVQFAAVSLSRLLLVNCPENARRVCTAAGGAEDQTTTHLQVLLDVFKEADQEPTKMEAARAALNVCRALHTDTSSIFPPDTSTGTAASDDLRAGYLYSTHARLPDTLLFLGLQKKYPLLRSELWFVLALMARSPAGAKVVTGLIQHRELLETLSEAVTGKSILGDQESNVESRADDASVQSGPDTAGIVGGISELGLEPKQVDPKQAASMAKVDRENGLVLINELMGQKPDDSNPLPLDALRRILKEGGDLILANKG